METVNKTTKLRIVSFNCRGLKNSVHDVTELCETSDIVLLQETWLTNDELSLLTNVHGQFYGKGVSNVSSKNITRSRRQPRYKDTKISSPPKKKSSRQRFCLFCQVTAYQ